MWRVATLPQVASRNPATSGESQPCHNWRVATLRVMVVSVVYVLQLTLMFIKPARRCRWQHHATDVAVAASRAQAGHMCPLGALLAADNARPTCRMV